MLQIDSKEIADIKTRLAKVRRETEAAIVSLQERQSQIVALGRSLASLDSQLRDQSFALVEEQSALEEVKLALAGVSSRVQELK
jgi:hypothetical protein